MDKNKVTAWGNTNMQGHGFRLNLQHFADEGEGGEGEKTYTQAITRNISPLTLKLTA